MRNYFQFGFNFFKKATFCFFYYITFWSPKHISHNDLDVIQYFNYRFGIVIHIVLNYIKNKLIAKMK